MAKIFKKNIVLVLLLCIPLILPLLKQGFFPTHDYIYVARIQQLDLALKSGHFPVRWSPDFRYGEALFNFYAPLPYYVGSFVHTIGFSFLSTTKILLGLSLVLSGLTMFFLGKELFGKWGGLIASTLYMYAPYRSVDIYVRGALSESWAFVFLPLIFLFSYKLFKRNENKHIILLALSLAGLFYTHNIMTMMIAPFLSLWLIILVIQNKKVDLIKKYLFGLLLGLGLGASYLIPAYFEKKFIQTQHLTFGYFDFRAHFVTLKQILEPFWGYGASTWGNGDGFSLQVGLVHLFIIGIGILVLIFSKKLERVRKIYLGVFIFSFFVSLFFQHNKSAFIWEKISQLEFIQFPWRFMGISIFFASIVGGMLTLLVKDFRLGRIGMVFLFFITVFTYVGYFKPESYYLDSIDEHYISKENILQRNDKVPKDYLPIWVKVLAQGRQETPKIILGEGEIINYDKKITSASFEVEMEKEGLIDVPIYYFPGWEVKVDGGMQEFKEPGELGFIRVEVEEGAHTVILNFRNTPLRNVSNLLTVASIGVVAFLVKRKNA